VISAVFRQTTDLTFWIKELGVRKMGWTWSRHNPSTNDFPRIWHARPAPTTNVVNKIHTSLSAHQETEIRKLVIDSLVEVCRDGCRPIQLCCSSSSSCSLSSKQSQPACVTLIRLSRSLRRFRIFISSLPTAILVMAMAHASATRL